MKCPLCAAPELVVVDSRPVSDSAVRRRRKCLTCGHRLTTMEMPVAEHQQRGAQHARLNEMSELLENMGPDDADTLLQLGRRLTRHEVDEGFSIPFFRRQAIGADA